MYDCNHNCKPPCPPPPCNPGTLPPPVCPPMAPIPPVNIPPCGDTSVWGAISQLTGRVNECIGQTNNVIGKAQQAIACIQAAACENGAYYGPNEVWLEEGYDATASAKYYIIHKKAVANDGSPIRMQLKLAYDNTTNSLLTQDAFEASQMEDAQMLVPAVPVNPNLGWFGLAMWQGAPIPSSTLVNAYTAGFTQSGRLKWYDNSTDIAQLRRDQIQNAMGVYGILVAGGEITDSALRAQIPNADQRTARVCIGQNYDTGEVIILSCGDTDSNGLTSAGCAAILKQYGCDVAVECCQGPTCCMLDKGQMVYTPDKHKVPASYAYWYITKKATYRNQITHELADLTQKYGQAIWAANLSYSSVSDIVEDITNVQTTVAQHTTDIAALKASSGQQGTDVSNLTSQVNIVSTRVETLEQTVNQIVSDSGTVGAQLQLLNTQISNLTTRLNQEISDRKEAFTNLQTALNTEITNRSNGDSALQTALNSLSTTVASNKADIDSELIAIKAELTTASSDIAEHKTKISNLQTQLQTLTDTVSTNYNTLEALIQTNITNIGTHTTQIASLLESMTKLDQAVSNYIIELADIESALNNIKEANTTILAQQADLLEKYNNLPADLTEFTDRMQAMETKQATLETNQSELEGKQTSLETRQEALSTQQDTLDTTVRNLETEVDSNTSMIETLQDDLPKKLNAPTTNRLSINVDTTLTESSAPNFKNFNDAISYIQLHPQYTHYEIHLTPNQTVAVNRNFRIKGNLAIISDSADSRITLFDLFTPPISSNLATNNVTINLTNNFLIYGDVWFYNLNIESNNLELSERGYVNLINCNCNSTVSAYRRLEINGSSVKEIVSRGGSTTLFEGASVQSFRADSVGCAFDFYSNGLPESMPSGMFVGKYNG